MTYETIQTVFTSFFIKLRNVYDLLREGHFMVFWSEVYKRMYSTTLSVGLRRDITKNFERPNAKIDISVRKLRKSDAGIILEHGEFAKANPRLAEYQQNLVEANIPNCYVAVTENDEPCYMQWLIGPDQNHRLKEHFGNTFPPLKNDEALLEAAFMCPAFRGNGIMPAAMSRITEQAKEIDGVKYVSTFVDLGNIPSLKGCKRAGFYPYIVRKDSWFLFIRNITFNSLSHNIVTSFEEATN